MLIGQVAKLTGASHKAIRHYEELGLLEGVARQGKYRSYSQHHVRVVLLIKKAQSLGFKLNEIIELMITKQRSGRFPFQLAVELIEKRQTQLIEQITKAQQQQTELETLKRELTAEFD